MRPRLALVPGEPAGIGPELVVRAAQHDWEAQLVIHGDAASLHRAAGALRLPIALHRSGEMPTSSRSLELVEIPHPVAAAFGQPEPANAASVIESMTRAAQACLDGTCDGLVTGPVHKAAINQGGIAFTGTTGLLASLASCQVVMMLANPGMRVALQTVHIPLRAVADAITADALSSTLRIVDTALRHQFGIAAPVIAVLGLNPHAGENGHLGREELDIIEPALEHMRSEGLSLVGPLPADTAFLPGKLRGFDAVLAMYHDQGLPVLKHADFANAVNITLGLPYPRVAVDHGTALDLAGKGVADPSSLFAAIRTCTQFARHRMHA
ncbi:4-hydroxythreonine-4-phosphate dehydrogenase PdxA [Thermomonas carbonis]|uniref:4-hydroxythreonine-4-phosphate dehydrogenase n=1 Tax=Thermomonas carbonis TaxID=1463158 RepID=A0A7G9SLW1_9GAMM|nr:4-hydroxythreonine-4-phosphate dehydrogenase PdxA [Thermomonas carbonis]QNN68836.1 4-hydroxythreonine-4-phosphate dehydrogenase PdxA [Thermomonas carbonis]GHC08427.1 4-hydroxythreonine-4-phosphate dehydrogenase [Thermomonas carbonis]